MVKQLSLYPELEPAPVKLLGDYDSVIVNYSNGIDSTGILWWAIQNFQKEKIFLVYCDTGLEYEINDALFYKTADFLGIKNRFILRHPLGFLGILEHRAMWPDSGNRWCTSYLKTDITNKWIRANRHLLGEKCLFVTGERRDESPRRARLPEVQIHATSLKTERKGIFTCHWYRPVLDFEKGAMFERGKILGLPPHPCYEYLTRCSCIACIFMPDRFAVENAIRYPKQFYKFVQAEMRIGHTWKQRTSLEHIWNKVCEDNPLGLVV